MVIDGGGGMVASQLLRVIRHRSRKHLSWSKPWSRRWNRPWNRRIQTQLIHLRNRLCSLGSNVSAHAKSRLNWSAKSRRGGVANQSVSPALPSLGYARPFRFFTFAAPLMRLAIQSLVVALVLAGDRVEFSVAPSCSDIAGAICKFRLGHRLFCKAQTSVC